MNAKNFTYSSCKQVFGNSKSSEKEKPDKFIENIKQKIGVQQK